MREKIVHGFAIPTITFFVIIGILGISALSSGAGVVTIYNTPPTFVSVKILDLGEEIQVVVEVSDMNGWEDIYRVYVNATDSSGNIVESALFSQYSTNSSINLINEFSELRGNSLMTGDQGSDVVRFRTTLPGAGGWSADWFNGTYERITFVFRPFSAYRVHVTALDRKMEKCEYSGPFSSKYEEPPLIEDPMVPLGLSLVIAAASGTGLYIHRRHSNRIAQLVEEKMGGG